MEFYDALLPFNQNDMIEVRESEPYSYCQFIMGKDHSAFGRARHPWLTGSAGWNYTAVTQWILGIRLSLEGLVVDPCIPSHWKEFEVRRKWGCSTFHISVKNPQGVQRGVKQILLDGKPISGAIPSQPAGSVHEVLVTMG
jgi:N,N'-diacetylchitobiose phosphorylase